MAESTTTYRQIRANYTETTIIVYQAFNAEIATAAVEKQKLDASPKYSTSRMTWIKPSWAWMLYRSGYSYKDPGQERILALTLKRKAFIALLRQSVLSDSHSKDGVKSRTRAERDRAVEAADVRVQWDPERTIRLERLDYRSIQIGIPGPLVDILVHGIVKIEDVTDRARELKRVMDGNAEISDIDLAEMGLVPNERAFIVDEELQSILGMNGM